MYKVELILVLRKAPKAGFITWILSAPIVCVIYFELFCKILLFLLLYEPHTIIYYYCTTILLYKLQ